MSIKNIKYKKNDRCLTGIVHAKANVIISYGYVKVE